MKLPTASQIHDIIGVTPSSGFIGYVHDLAAENNSWDDAYIKELHSEWVDSGAD